MHSVWAHFGLIITTNKNILKGPPYQNKKNIFIYFECSHSVKLTFNIFFGKLCKACGSKISAGKYTWIAF